MSAARVIWRGVRVDPRTAQMLNEVARLTPTLPTLSPSQGSYNTTVGASAGTHAGGGAVDLRTSNLTTGQTIETVRVMRIVGFAAWRRLPSEGNWSEHIHGIAVGQHDLSPSAARQVVALRAGRNGLANNGPDPHSSLNVPVRTWEQYQAAKPPPPPPPKDDDMPYRDWPQADKNALVDDVAAAVWRRDNPQTDTHYGVLLSRLYRRYYEAQPRLGQPDVQWHGIRYIRELDRVLRVVLAQLETASAERAVVRELVAELVARGPSSLTVEDLDAAVERGMQRHRVELQVKLLELEAAEQEEPDDPDEES